MTLQCARGDPLAGLSAEYGAVRAMIECFCLQGRRYGQEQARPALRPEDAKRLQAQSDDGAAGRRLP
jgi:hypothetical protein